MASANSNAALFGDDSDDSSDESVAAGTATATTDPSTGEAAPGEEAENDDEAKTSTDSDADAAGAGADDDAVAPPSAAGTSSKNTDNSALFGDDDDSSEDGEFDGGDDIVGRSGNVAKRTEVVVEKSMNQRLGLDSDSDDEPGPTKSTSEGAGEDEDSKKPIYAPPRRMELTNLPGIHDTIPAITTTTIANDSKDEPIHFITKLPNLVAINPEPYNATTHDAEKEEEQYRGYVHNMIRWRYKTNNSSGEIMRDENGNPLRESNTRIVKWSDGSYTLHIGTEVLEVDNLDSSIPVDHPEESMAGFPGSNGYLYVSQQASIRFPSKKEWEKGPPNSDDENVEEAIDEDDDDEDNMPPQSAGTVLECIAPITSRLSCRPSSLASEAHRNHTLAVRQRNIKRARIAEIVTEVDPEKEKLARIKGKDDMEKIRARHSGGGVRRTYGGGSTGRRRGMNESYLEEGDEDDYDGVNIGRLKKQTMRRDNSDEEEMDYGDDDDDDSEEDEEDWMSKKKQTRGAAAARASKGERSAASSSKENVESSEEGEVVFGDDDDDDEEEDAAFGKKRGGGSGVKKAVLSDDEDE